ncbi:MAG: hypothetical protein ACPGU0_01190, partial [Marinirhabdus sp.]
RRTYDQVPHYEEKTPNGKTLKGESNYELLIFAHQNGVQQIMIVYPNDGRFAEGVKDRIINSVELELQQTQKPPQQQ